MRLTVIKHDDNGTIFYIPAVFTKNEDLIIFPFKEFDKFYNETAQNISIIKNIIKDYLKPDSAITPRRFRACRRPDKSHARRLGPPN